MEKRSRITILAIILATFAAGALVWFLAQPTDEVPDVAQEAQEQLAQQTQQPTPVVQQRSQNTPDDTTVFTAGQQPTPIPKVASAVSTSAQTGPAENLIAMLLAVITIGAIGVRKFSTV